jgi:hypothetical protein
MANRTRNHITDLSFGPWHYNLCTNSNPDSGANGNRPFSWYCILADSPLLCAYCTHSTHTASDNSDLSGGHVAIYFDFSNNHSNSNVCTCGTNSYIYLYPFCTGWNANHPNPDCCPDNTNSANPALYFDDPCGIYCTFGLAISAFASRHRTCNRFFMADGFGSLGSSISSIYLTNATV